MNMTCPYCGQPMEKGFVMTNLRYSIFWLPETADKVPLIIDRDGVEIEQKGVILADRGHVFKKTHPWNMIATAKEMYVCRDCKKALLEIDKELEKMEISTMMILMKMFTAVMQSR